ncbi:transposase [Halorussus sp. GCM10023401]|uniref:transposase n=1 Tax=Halorussus sp. GCM10023401 TaxID=3252680 RepID=UPI00362446A6
MSEIESPKRLSNHVLNQLETATTLSDLVRRIDANLFLRAVDYESFEDVEYNAVPTVRALFCRELAGFSWNGLYEFLSTDGRAVDLGFDSTKFGKYNTAPTRQTLTAAWDTVLSDATKRTILSVSERLVNAAYKNDDALDLRQPRYVDENDSDLRERHVGEFSNDQIRKCVRLARNTVFGAFDSGRAGNTKYPDSRFGELQAFMALGECGTPEGQSRMENFFGEDYTPHGDTHLRTVNKFSANVIQEGFTQSIENLLDAVNHVQILQRPVTAAIDITTWDFHADGELPSEVNGTKDPGRRAYKFATLSLVGKSMPIILASAPVIESSAWDENLSHHYHQTVRKLVKRAQKFVNIDLVLADRGFESLDVYQTLENLGVDYLLPKIEYSNELEVAGRMEQEGEDVAVERAAVDIEIGSHECRLLYVPGGDGETQTFITNRAVAPEDAEAWVEHYANRWCIENEYRAIKQEFLARTSSKNHDLRVYYFVFGILMYNVWRLADVLLKATVTREITDYTPAITAGELADWVAIHLQAEPD